VVRLLQANANSVSKESIRRRLQVPRAKIVVSGHTTLDWAVKMNKTVCCVKLGTLLPSLQQSVETSASHVFLANTSTWQARVHVLIVAQESTALSMGQPLNPFVSTVLLAKSNRSPEESRASRAAEGGLRSRRGQQPAKAVPKDGSQTICRARAARHARLVEI
jgi:hypothetical protein